MNVGRICVLFLMAKLYHFFGDMRIQVFSEKQEFRFFGRETGGEKQMLQSNWCLLLMAKLYHFFWDMRIRLLGEKQEFGKFFGRETGGEKVRTFLGVSSERLSGS